MTEKKTVYITGGSKGIGKGIAAHLLNNGYRVAISGRTLKQVQETADELGDSSSVLAIQSDVREPKDEVKAIKTIIDTWGRLDVIIANAGLGIFAPIDEMKHEEWNQVIDTNVNGVFNTVKASIEELKKTEGYIFTIASLAGTNFFPKGTAYNASKYAVVGFSHALMLDMRPYNIKVSTIMPGSVTSNFNNHTPNEEDAWKVQPEDMGQLVYDMLQMHPRALPSRVEIRPSNPPVRPGSAPQ